MTNYFIFFNTKLKKNSVLFLLLFIFITDIFAQNVPGDFSHQKSVTDNLSAPVRMAISNSGYVYVTDAYNKQIKKFDLSGNFIGNVNFQGVPLSVAVSDNNALFVGDGNNGRIFRIDHNGSQTEIYTASLFPSDMVTGPDNLLYIVDEKLKCVLVIDFGGNLVRTIGAGVLLAPTSIAYDRENKRIIVSEHGGVGTGFNLHSEIRIFSLTGTLISTFGGYGNANGKFYRTQGMTVGRCGNIYVSDPFQGMISVFNENGVFITRFGQFGNTLGQLNVTMDLDFDSEQNLWITSMNNGALEVFSITDLLPSATITSGSEYICDGESADISISFKGTAPWSFTYTVDGLNPATVNNTYDNPYILTTSVPGSYNITSLTDSATIGTCLSGTADIIVNTTPTAVMASETATICSGATAYIPVSFTGMKPFSFTYTVDNLNPVTVDNIYSDSYIIQANASGTYEIISLTGGECVGTSITGSTLVVVNESPVANMGNMTINLCEGQTAEIAVDLTGTAPWSFTYAVDGLNPVTVTDILDNHYILTVSAAGAYEVINVSDANCNDGESGGIAYIYINPLPTAEIVSGNSTICNGETANVEVEFTGISPWGFEYTVDGLNPVVVAGITSNPYFIQVSQAGNYELTSVSGPQCSGNVIPETSLITVIPVPTASINSGNAVICQGQTTDIAIDLSGTGPWSLTYTRDGLYSETVNNINTSPYILTVEDAGTYEVSALSDATCTGDNFTGSATVSVTALPTASIISGDVTICSGDFAEVIVDLTGSMPFSLTYTIDGIPVTVADIYSNTYVIEAIQPGVYEISGVSGNSCAGNSYTGSVQISVVSLPTAQIISGNTSICSGETSDIEVNMTGNGPWNLTFIQNGLFYSTINNISTSPYILNVSDAGIYEISDLSDALCTGSDISGSAQINVLSLPTVDLGADADICVGNNLTLDAGGPFADYLWNDGTTGQTIQVNAGGNYSVTVTDGSGCVNTDDLLVTSHLVPLAGFAFSITNTEISFTNTSVNADTYLWDFGDGQTSNLSDPIHLYPSVSNTYYVSLTASNPFCDLAVIYDTIDIMITGVGGNISESSFVIYPNPSDGLVNIEISNPGLEDQNLEITSMTGQLVYLDNFSSAVVQKQIDMSAFANGVYTIILTSREVIKKQKLILVK